jgi:hypothetical protein
MGREFNQPLPQGIDLRSLQTWNMGNWHQPLPAGINLSGLKNWKMSSAFNWALPDWPM